MDFRQWLCEMCPSLTFCCWYQWKRRESREWYIGRGHPQGRPCWFQAPPPPPPHRCLRVKLCVEVSFDLPKTTFVAKVKRSFLLFSQPVCVSDDCLGWKQSRTQVEAAAEWSFIIKCRFNWSSKTSPGDDNSFNSVVTNAGFTRSHDHVISQICYRIIWWLNTQRLNQSASWQEPATGLVWVWQPAREATIVAAISELKSLFQH